MILYSYFSYTENVFSTRAHIYEYVPSMSIYIIWLLKLDYSYLSSKGF